ncbi:MAG: DUF4129 domain-containing protein [Anaerolineae bacterium]
MSAPSREVRLPLGVWWRLLLTSGMMWVTVLTLLDLVAAAGLPWRGGYLALATVLVPLESYLSHRAIVRRELRGEDLTRFRVAEAITLVVVLLVLRFAWQGLPQLGGRVERLLDLEFFFSAGVLLGFWGLANALVRWFEEIEFHPAEKPPPVTSPEYDMWLSSPARRVQHTAAFRKVLSTFLAGGILILVLAGLARVDPAAIVDFRRGTIRLLILHVLVYFVLGLALVAEARLTLLRTRWQHEEAQISPAVARRWPALVAGLLLLVLVVALALPVDYSVGLLDAISYTVQLLAGILATIAYAILYVIGLLLYPLRWLVAMGGGEEAPPPPPPMQMPDPQPAGPGAPPFLEILKTVVLWGLAVAMVVYALRNFLREHGASLRGVGLLQPLLRALDLVLAAIKELLGRSARAGTALTRALVRRVRGARAPVPGGWRRPRGLTAREMVRYYYLSTVRRGAAVGVPRRRNQTPEEYSRRLRDQVPEAEEDLSALTDAFIEARYSAHPVDQAYARGVRPHWEGVKRALRALRGKTQS